MKIAIVSPHTDDALFSLGSMISKGKDNEITIVSPFAGVPDDKAGKLKHTTLRREHAEACKTAGVKYINGDFFDDVYGKQDEKQVAEWLVANLWSFDLRYIPLGIHHPDHIFIRDVFLNLTGLKADGFYEELPYRELYQELYSEAVQSFTTGLRRVPHRHLIAKEKSVKKYDSQLAPHLYPQLFVTEGIWE